MPHYINKMPQCHNSLWTAQYVATNCHINATMPQPYKPLKINDATNATNATTKKVFVCMQENVVLRTQKAPRKNTFFPRAKDMI